MALPDEIDAPGETPDMDLMNVIGISADDATRIQRRVKRVLELREAASGFEDLKSDHRSRLGMLKNGVRLISIPSEHCAVGLAAELHDDMPWMARPAKSCGAPCANRFARADPGSGCCPFCSTPPGSENPWVRRLGELLATLTKVLEAAGENASFGVVGSRRGREGSCPRRPIETALQSCIVDPVMVVGKAEKSSGPLPCRVKPPGWPRRFCRFWNL